VLNYARGNPVAAFADILTYRLASRTYRPKNEVASKLATSLYPHAPTSVERNLGIAKFVKDYKGISLVSDDGLKLDMPLASLGTSFTINGSKSDDGYLYLMIPTDAYYSKQSAKDYKAGESNAGLDIVEFVNWMVSNKKDFIMRFSDRVDDKDKMVKLLATINQAGYKYTFVYNVHSFSLCCRHGKGMTLMTILGLVYFSNLARNFAYRAAADPVSVVRAVMVAYFSVLKISVNELFPSAVDFDFKVADMEVEKATMVKPANKVKAQEVVFDFEDSELQESSKRIRTDVAVMETDYDNGKKN